MDARGRRAAGRRPLRRRRRLDRRAWTSTPSSPTATAALLARRQDDPGLGPLPVADAGLPAGPPLRAGDRRAVRRLSRRASLVQAGPLSRLVPPRPRRLGPEAGRGAGRRRHGLLPRRRGGDPRGRGRPGSRRRHRAGAFPLPVPRRAGLSPGDLARLSAPRRRAGARRRAEQADASTRWRRWPATRRSAMRRPTARRSRRSPAARSRSAPRCCAASPSSWNAWPTTPATWAPWPATSGFLPTASYCGRLRGDFLNLTALLCGSRFGRGLVRPGGVGFDLDEDRERAVPGAPGGGATATWPARSTCSGTRRRCRPGSRGPGPCLAETAWRLGLVGPAARACGLERDVRQDFPVGHLPLRPGPGLDLDDRRRLRPRLRALAGDPAVRGVHPRTSSRRFPTGRSARTSGR